MTYRELRDNLNELTKECLNADVVMVVMFESGMDEYYPIYNLILADETCDVLDEGHPLLVGK